MIKASLLTRVATTVAAVVLLPATPALAQAVELLLHGGRQRFFL